MTTNATAPSGATMTLETVTALYAEWARTVTDRDRDGLTRVLAPEYRFTTPDGQRLGRDETVDIEMKAPPPEAMGGFVIQHVTDDVVIVRGHDIVRGKFPESAAGPELAARLLEGVQISFTSVWRRRDGRWSVVSNDAHVTDDRFRAPDAGLERF